MATLERVALTLGAVTAAHIALQFVDRRRLSSAHNVERDGLMGVSAQAFNFKVEVAGIERIAQCRGGLGRTLIGDHAFIRCLAAELIGFLARLRGALLRCAYRRAVDALS
jgi:hypothetical protein